MWLRFNYMYWPDYKMYTHSEQKYMNNMNEIIIWCNSLYVWCMYVQHLNTFLTDLSGVDLDGADILSTLHSLYSMTFTALGKFIPQTIDCYTGFLKISLG